MAFSVVYDQMVLIDTSAVIALHDPREQYYSEAKDFYDASLDLCFLSIDVTAHEAFTRGRYDYSLRRANDHFNFLRASKIKLLTFNAADEHAAVALVNKYKEHVLSFHDALCSVIMDREGIFKVFTFDKHFLIMGYEIFPGRVR